MNESEYVHVSRTVERNLIKAE